MRVMGMRMVIVGVQIGNTFAGFQIPAPIFGRLTSNLTPMMMMMMKMIIVVLFPKATRRLVRTASANITAARFTPPTFVLVDAAFVLVDAAPLLFLLEDAEALVLVDAKPVILVGAALFRWETALFRWETALFINRNLFLHSIFLKVGR